MHLLFADGLPRRTLDALEARGHTCVSDAGLTAGDLPGAVAGFDGLVVRSTPVGRAVFESADRLALVIRAGSGTDTIDTLAAAAHGVVVRNVPGRNAAAVAELTMGLLLAIDRRIADNVLDLRNGHWDKERYSTAAGLLGSTMGIIGLGSVGFAVAERAAGFGISLQALAVPGRAAEALARAARLGITMRSSMDELLSSSDIVSLHVPHCDDTHHLVDGAFLDRMREGAILLNTSRGGLVDEQALLKALDAGRVRVGLDVFADEPDRGQASWDSPLARHPDVVATHHIGASTRQAQDAIAAGVVEIVDAFAAADVVRRFAARVVRPDRARRLVTPMVEFPDEAGTGLGTPPADPAAYDDSPAALYVYRQHDDGSPHVGLVCELAIDAFADGRVRGHEAVQPDRVEALVRHQARTGATPALVTLIHRAGPAFTHALAAAVGAAPILDFAGPGEVRQRVWRVPDGPVAAAVTTELAAADHYIADGHHRVAAALEAWSLSGHPAGTGVLCVVHAMDGLRLSAFHRRLPGPVDPSALRALLTPTFRIRAASRAPTPAPGCFGLYLAGAWFDVWYEGTRADGLAGLDAAILQSQVLDRYARRRQAEVTPVRASVDELTGLCDADGGALFTLAPPPLEMLTSLADAGLLMPPKTTYFSPKPCAGIFLRP